MSKFKIGDKCRVVKNLLAPSCVGCIVHITDCISINGKLYYKVSHMGNTKGFASEKCLELIKEQENA